MALGFIFYSSSAYFTLSHHLTIMDTLQAVLAKAKDMHPKLAGGMFVFFALGAIGGMMSLLMQDKPIFER
jgi:hypothetical protein